MNSKYVVMIAGLAKPGMDVYVRKSLIEIMNQARLYEGCLLYNIHESTRIEGEFMVYMIWVNESSYKKYNEMPCIIEFNKKLSFEWFDYQSKRTYWSILE